MANDITVKLVPVSASASEAHIRQHTVFIDRPEAKGGADQGRWAASCFSRRWAAV